MAPERPAKKAKPSSSSSKPVASSAPKQFSISTFLPKLPVPPPIADYSTLPASSSSSGSKPAARSATIIKPAAKSVGSSGKGKAKEVETAEDAVEALWIDKYAPSSRDELGVHPKKVTDVSNWLGEAFNPKLAKYRRILVMSGPSGAAKTSTLRILTEEEGIDVLQYRTGSNHDFAGNLGKDSMVNQFTEFLARAGMAPALEFEADPSLPSPPSSQSKASTSTSFSTSSSTNTKRLILLEDLPNISHYPTKMALRSALQQYLSSPRVTCPLVVIISEALARPGMGHEAESLTGEGRNESIDARSVCGVEVLNSPGCREIEFNPVAVTIMKKALLKVLDKAYPSSSSARPSTSTLEQIIALANGDIRSALMSLEFLASNPIGVKGVTSLAGGNVAGAKKGKKRKADDDGTSGDQVKKLLQFVTARENSLFIFHALGKVLYSKRWGVSEEDDKKDEKRQGLAPNFQRDRLPKHLRAEWSRAPSKVDPDVLFAEAPVDSDVFMSYMHHNYTAFTNEIEECLGIVEGLSTADALMRREGEDWLRRAPLTSQYSFNVAVRSTLLSLPSPVPHRKQVMKKSELWERLRTQSANAEGVVDMFKRRTDDVGSGMEGGNQRSRGSLVGEFIPWLGVIERSRRKNDNKSKFWMGLATFPPIPSDNFVAFIKGEVLGEKEVDEEEEEDLDQEMSDEEESEVDLMDLEVTKEDEAEWFETEDDIQD